MRALQHYTDLVDIKRVIVNTHAIDPQALTEFFGSLSAEWALDCLKVRGVQQLSAPQSHSIGETGQNSSKVCAAMQHTEVLLAHMIPRSCSLLPAGGAPACWPGASADTTCCLGLLRQLWHLQFHSRELCAKICGLPLPSQHVPACRSC